MLDVFELIEELKAAAPEWAAAFENALNEGKAVHIIDNRNVCTKVKYGHKETAETAAVAMHRKTGDTYDAYHCQPCEAWHIGHSR